MSPEQRIAEIGKLQPNWDSYGASPINRETCLLAALLSPEMIRCGLTMIQPTVSGGIEFSDNDDSIWVTVFCDNEEPAPKVETAAIQSDPDAMRAIEISQQQIADGKTVSWESVKEELGL